MTRLSYNDKQRIAAAIAEVEQHTSGELVTVIARSADDYIYIPTLAAALLALVTPGVIGLLGQPWLIEHSYLLQIISFMCFASLFRWPPITMRLIPKPVKYQRAHRVAMEQFFAQNLHHTRQRTGVLLFVSIAEHYVEIIADQGINDRVPLDAWQGIVNRFITDVKSANVAEGFITAVNACGVLLKEHFPAGETNKNELANHLVEL